MLVLYLMLGLIVLPGIILGIYAQSKVTSTYNTYSKIESNCGMTASQITRAVLDRAGLHDIELKKVRGHLTDHYHPKQKYIGLSESVYDSTSVAALGVALHEVGHAIQKQENYFFLKFRQFLIPVTNFASTLLWPMVIIGFLLGAFSATGSSIGNIFVIAGIAFYGLAVLLSLITLPVEFNASKRALKMLEGGNFLNEAELDGARKVLSSAALTYVASFVVAVLELFQFLIYLFIARE